MSREEQDGKSETTHHSKYYTVCYKSDKWFVINVLQDCE